MDLEQMKQYKLERGYSFQRLAELTGLPLGTIQKIFTGETKHPREKTILALEKVLLPDAGEAGCVAESAPAYGVQPVRIPMAKKFTLEDYYALPEDQRAELIDGVVYLMSAPSLFHQAIVGEIFGQLRDQIRRKKGPCRVFISPADVRLDRDDYTMVQPDVFIVCKKDRLQEKYLEGAPDYVVEILSPSTRRKDICVKLAKYAEAGVREYWIVDPDRRQVMVYDMRTEDVAVSLYTFEDEIPLAIYDGEITVDMKQVELL